MGHLADRNDLFRASAHTPSRIWGVTPCPLGLNGKINPHRTRLFLRDGRVADRNHSKPIYYETEDGFWRPLSEVTTWHGNRFICLKPSYEEVMSPRYFRWLTKRQALLGSELHINHWGVQPRQMAWMATDISFPNADGDTDPTTVDGAVSIDNKSSWAAAHDAASGNVAVSDVSTAIIQAQQGPGQLYDIDRFFCLFDTSGIGDTDTITAATLDLFVTAVSDEDDDGDDYISLVDSTPATNTDLITSDYNQVGTTEHGDKPDLSSVTTSQDNTITLDASGREAISKTGVSKFGVREGHDVLDNPIANGTENSITIRTADWAGTDSDPTLTVTFTAATAATGFNPLIIMG